MKDGTIQAQRLIDIRYNDALMRMGAQVVSSTTTRVPPISSLLTAESCSPGATLTTCVQLKGSSAPLVVAAVTALPVTYRTPPVDVAAPGAVNDM